MYKDDKINNLKLLFFICFFKQNELVLFYHSCNFKVNSFQDTMAKLLLLILAWLHSGCSFNIYGSTLGLPAPYASLPQPYSYNQQVGHSQVYTNGLVYGQMQPFLPYSPLAYLYQPYAIVRTGITCFFLL